MSDRFPKIKKWVLSPHAAERMIERDISIKELESIIQMPDSLIRQGPKFILFEGI